MTPQADGKAVVDKVFETHSVVEGELTLTTDEVTERLGEAERWTDFSLEASGTGQYLGQAKSPNGELFNVEVRQTADGIYSRWVNADDNGSGYAAITGVSKHRAVVDKVFETHSVVEGELTLTTDEVKERLGEAERWTDFSLEASGTGQYLGQAKSPNGELLNVEVRQTADGIYSRWINADDSGSGCAFITW